MPAASARLLRRAVIQSSPASLSGIMERAFSRWFSGFVYNQIWEDPAVDLTALALTPECRLLTIASGGCNICNYLVAPVPPESVAAVDLNPNHIHLARLKLACARFLPDHEAFFRFFGEADAPANLDAYRGYVRRHLDPETRDYWDAPRGPLGRPRINWFAEGFYDVSRLGRFLRLLHRLCRLTGRDPSRLLACRTQAELAERFQAELAPLFDHPLVRLACRRSVSLFSLGIPPQQFQTLMAEAEGEFAALLRERVRRLVCDHPLTTNYFAWQALSRRYDRANRAAVPPYLDPARFDWLRANACRADVRQADLIGLLAAEPEGSFDRYVLLDAQDWMTPERLTTLWQGIRRTARPDARVIFRTAATASPLPLALPPELLAAFDYDEEASRALLARDRSGIYGGFHLYRLRGA